MANVDAAADWVALCWISFLRGEHVKNTCDYLGIRRLLEIKVNCNRREVYSQIFAAFMVILISYIQLCKVIDGLLLDGSMSPMIDCQLPMHPRCCRETQHIRCII